MNDHGILTTEPQEMKFIEDPAIQLLREIVRQNEKIIKYLTREQNLYYPFDGLCNLASKSRQKAE